MIKAILNKFRKKPKGATYWKTIMGHRIYYFEDVAKMPEGRTVATKLEMAKLGMGVTPAHSRAFLKVQSKEFNSLRVALQTDGDVTPLEILDNLTYLSKEYEIQLNQFAGEVVQLGIAGMSILVDDEPRDEFLPEYNAIKRKLLNNDEVYAFFLSRTIELADHFRPDTKDHLTKWIDPQTRYQEKKFSQLIGEEDFKSLWSNTTERLRGYAKG